MNKVVQNLTGWRVGDFFKCKDNEAFGWVTGAGLNPIGEAVLKVIWAKYPEKEALCHPALIKKI